MTTRAARAAAALLIAAGAVLGGPGCGILMHPERDRALTRSSRVATESILLDCCWLLVAIIPGVVALVVDFSSGGAYYQITETSDASGNRHAIELRGEGDAIVIVVDGVERARAPRS